MPYANAAEQAEAGPQADELRVDVRFTLETQRAGGRPVLLYIHGGAWLKGMGDKTGYGQLEPPAPEFFAERGWVTCSMDYRLVDPRSPKQTRSRWPAMLVDVKRAIRWIRENAEQFGGRPDWVAVCGGSAGGHLALLAGMLAGPEYQPGFEDVDTSVRAVVSYYPAVDTLEAVATKILHGDVPERGGAGASAGEAERERASPLHSVSRCPVPATFPRIMVIQGTRDALCPVNKCRLFVELLRQRLAHAGRRGVDDRVCYLELPRGRHAFDVIHGVRSWCSLLAANRFLTQRFEATQKET